MKQEMNKENIEVKQTNNPEENNPDQQPISSDAQAQDVSPVDKKKKLIRELIYYACLVVALIIINKCVIVNAYIPSGSMEKTIMTGDYVVGNRLAKHNIDRYDIIIFYGEDGKYLIKRVIGLPGETIEIKNGNTYADGKKLKDSFTQGETKEDGIYECNGYFVMGDNRENSYDSRYWEKPCVPEKKVVAKASFRLWKGFKKL